MSFLKSNPFRLCNSIVTLKRVFVEAVPSGRRMLATSPRDQPVQFSTSKAKAHDPVNTFVRNNNKPASQFFIIIGSILVLFVYAIFREENELDSMFDRPLEDTIPNIREMTLRYQIEDYKKMGLDTTELQQALKKELERQKLIKL